jgi:ferredoxin--NADP+ reductase
LTYLPSITRPDEDPHYRGQTGRIQSLVAGGIVEKLSGVVLDPDSSEVFLCGNPDMIQEVKALLQAKGFTVGKGKEPGSIHVEEYW